MIEKNINFAINFIDPNDVDLNFASVKNEAFKSNLQVLFQKLKDEPNLDLRTETFDEVRSIINLDSPCDQLDYRQNRLPSVKTALK